jgi:uncharacterized protein YcfL
MKTNTVAGLSVAAAVALLAGCATTVNTVENADKAGVREMVADRRVVSDRTLENRVIVVGINQSQTDAGFLRVQLEFYNKKRTIQNFFYTVEWFGADGMRVETATGGWTEQQVMARESLFLTFTAPTPRAKDFVVKLVEDPRR